MLVLSRREGERLILDGGRIVVTVVASNAYRVRLGIDAPRECSIDREEIYRSKEAERGRGGGGDAGDRGDAG